MVLEIKGEIRTTGGWLMPYNTVTLRKNMAFMVNFGLSYLHEKRIKQYMKENNLKTECPSLYEIRINVKNIPVIVTFAMVKKGSQKYSVMEACGFHELYYNE